MSKRKVRDFGPVVYFTEIEGDFGDEDCPRCVAVAAGYDGWEPYWDGEEITGFILYSWRLETDKEHQSRLKAETNRDKAVEAAERAQYERLKQKFG